MAAVDIDEQKARKEARMALLDAITAQANVVKDFEGQASFGEHLMNLGAAYAAVVSPSTGAPGKMHVG